MKISKPEGIINAKALRQIWYVWELRKRIMFFIEKGVIENGVKKKSRNSVIMVRSLWKLMTWSDLCFKWRMDWGVLSSGNKHGSRRHVF